MDVQHHRFIDRADGLAGDRQGLEPGTLGMGEPGYVEHRPGAVPANAGDVAQADGPARVQGSQPPGGLWGQLCASRSRLRASGGRRDVGDLPGRRRVSGDADGDEAISGGLEASEQLAEDDRIALAATMGESLSRARVLGAVELSLKSALFWLIHDRATVAASGPLSPVARKPPCLISERGVPNLFQRTVAPRSAAAACWAAEGWTAPLRRSTLPPESWTSRICPTPSTAPGIVTANSVTAATAASKMRVIRCPRALERTVAPIMVPLATRPANAADVCFGVRPDDRWNQPVICRGLRAYEVQALSASISSWP